MTLPYGLKRFLVWDEETQVKIEVVAKSIAHARRVAWNKLWGNAPFSHVSSKQLRCKGLK